jgi:hypothetical protein
MVDLLLLEELGEEVLALEISDVLLLLTEVR